MGRFFLNWPAFGQASRLFRRSRKRDTLVRTCHRARHRPIGVEMLEGRTLLAQVLQPNPLSLHTLSSAAGYCNDGTVGALLWGRHRDKFGSSVSGAGDVNGDGLDDVIIGAQAAGESYVLFGRADRYTDVFVGLGSGGIGIDNTADPIVSSAGDVNGDGFDDVIIGSPRAVHGSATEAGRSYVVFGRAGSSHYVDVAALDGTNGFQIAGTNAFDHFGSSVGSAGDLNGDGFGDIVIGAPDADPHGESSGRAYVVFGRSVFPATIDLASLDGTNGFSVDGAAESGHLGKSVSGAGDLNGDGIEDLVIGAPDVPRDLAISGETYVLFGHSGTYPTSVQVTSIDEASGFRIHGPHHGLGGLVAAGGDLNGDGFDDLIIAPRAYGSSYPALTTYVIFGRAAGYTEAVDVTQLSGTTGFRLTPPTAGSFNDVGTAGDVNDDGFGDLVVAVNAMAYLVYGHSGEFSNVDLASLDGTAGYRIGADRGSGLFARGAGDVNGDGYDDLVLGSPQEDSPGVGFVILQRAHSMDFGDAPKGLLEPDCGLQKYFTRMASDGARHLLGSGLYLGSLVDAEISANPHATASGDDLHATDDEDGVMLPGRLLPGKINAVIVEASLDGRLDAWIDFDQNGFDAGDQIANDLPVHAGANDVSLLVPFRSLAGKTFARFRISSAGGLAPYGQADDGEVEDYAVEIDGVDLRVTIDGQGAVGPLMTYTLTASNHGRIDATNLRLMSPSPTVLTFASATVPQGSCVASDGTVTCSLGTLTVGGSLSVTLAYRPTGPDTFSYRATARSDEPFIFVNNAEIASRIGSAAGPDLWGSVTAYQSCKTSRRGTACTLNATIIIQNSGSMDSPKTYGRAYWSSDAILHGNDRTLVEGKIGAIKAGARRQIRSTIRLTPNLADTYFFVVLDPAGIAAEISESNNVMYTLIHDVARARNRSVR